MKVSIERLLPLTWELAKAGCQPPSRYQGSKCPPSPIPQRYRPFMDPIEQLITEALLPEIKISERAFLLNQCINQKHENLDKGIKKDISLILYDLSYTELVMSLARLFDLPNKKYPTRCIKSLYKLAGEAKDNSSNHFRKNVELQIHHFGFHANYIDSIFQFEDAIFVEHAIKYFEAREINPPISNSLNNLRTIRNKFLAHNEKVDLNTLVPYKDVEIVLLHAKNVVSFFALYYCNIYLMPSGEYYLSHSAIDWVNKYELFINDNGL